MDIVVFKTEEGIFQFNRSEVIKYIKREISNNNLAENMGKFKLLSNTAEGVIEIDQDDESFGYLLLELIKIGTGQVTCKRCDKSYNNSELNSFPLGAGKSPLRPNIDIKRFGSLFYRRKRNPSLIGGIGYRCSAGHELIMLVTWRT
jgi:hypothetical protein